MYIIAFFNVVGNFSRGNYFKSKFHFPYSVIKYQLSMHP